MKILLVNTTSRTGGASIACQRLKHALEGRGHEVRLMVRADVAKEATIFQRAAAKMRFVWERLCLLRYIPYSRVFSIDDGRCGRDITATDDYRWADVVHLHWVNQAMVSLLQLKRLFERCKADGKCVVWTLHDTWPATGICHLPGTCEKWKTGCNDCPLLRTSHPDLAATVAEQKMRAYQQGDVRFVACSQYMRDNVLQAALMRGQKVTDIPNPLDTDFFSPGAEERQRLGLPSEKRLVLFVAYNVNDDNKNFRLVQQAVEKIVAAAPSKKDEIAIVPVGKNATQWKDRFSCEVVPFEYVSDNAMMRSLYRSCDVLVVASKMENLPNTIAEAKACGLPVVATRVGGIPEMVSHKNSGFLIESDDAESMAEGLRFVLFEADAAALSAAARQEAVTNYSEENVAQRYEQLYFHDKIHHCHSML